MGDKRLNDLLKWSIQNTNTDNTDSSHTGQQESNGVRQAPRSDLTPEVMAALMGGPSDADLMKASIEIITSPDADVSLENKLIAFENFEQLIEGLDNANNIAPLNLWTPLLDQLKSPEAEIRKMSCWCIGTAVQNNEKTQERLLAMGGLPTIISMALSETETAVVRRKAVYALSSAVRNYQPAMDLCSDELTKLGRPTGKVDAGDMEACDVVMTDLRERIQQQQ